MKAGAVKYSMKISKWPFRYISNMLQIGMISQAQKPDDMDNGNCESFSYIDQNNNVLSSSVSYSGLTLYGRFLDIGILDGEYRTIQYTFDSGSNHFLVGIPHFWDFVEFDPDYQALVDVNADDGCDSPNRNKHSKHISNAVIGGVVGGVVGLAIIAGVIAWYIIKRKERKKDKSAIAVRSSLPIPLESVDNVNVNAQRKRTIISAEDAGAPIKSASPGVPS
eukprot:Phypoly_transcript_18372.p1 GENE.Phypoly_transcript_18372~~Phypoly_transcript_18372.p1  ORF type:complete len:251 (+),score=23.56 Phypoly_transcript_18372:91-753(+)